MTNDEKILSMLVALTEKVDKIDKEHGEQLAEQGKQLTSIDRRLEQVEVTQAEQGKQLAELTDKVDSLAEKIDRDVIPYVKLLDDDYSSIGRRVTALEKAN